MTDIDPKEIERKILRFAHAYRDLHGHYPGYIPVPNHVYNACLENEICIVEVLRELPALDMMSLSVSTIRHMIVIVPETSKGITS